MHDSVFQSESELRYLFDLCSCQVHMAWDLLFKVELRLLIVKHVKVKHLVFLRQLLSFIHLRAQFRIDCRQGQESIIGQIVVCHGGQTLDSHTSGPRGKEVVCIQNATFTDVVDSQLHILVNILLQN